MRQQRLVRQQQDNIIAIHICIILYISNSNNARKDKEAKAANLIAEE